MPRPQRPLSEAEIQQLLSRDVLARLATLDRDGYPRVTPIWFEWDGNAFYMTSVPEKTHVRRLAHDPRASICVDVEDAESDDGERPNQTVRAVGPAEIFPDDGAVWTRRITEKYIQGSGREVAVRRRTSEPRVVIRLQPVRMFAVSSV